MSSRTRSNWKLVARKNSALWIVDLYDQSNPTLTITNDTEAVIHALRAEHGLDAERVFYRDTDGRWDELLHDGRGGFVGFAFGTDGFTPPEV